MILGLLVWLFVPQTAHAASIEVSTTTQLTTASLEATTTLPVVTPFEATTTVAVPDVPFYSQFTDVSAASWQKRACGIASLAMLIEYYEPEVVSVNKLLSQGINAGAYSKVGWTYAGLIKLAHRYGLEGETHDYWDLSAKRAFAELTSDLQDGPVMVSVHYKFNPKSPIPHLVVINGIDSDTVYYNDPAAKEGGKEISIDTFLKAWKKRYIVIRPPETTDTLALR